ncbi:MAG: o-succinylbenzoate synthase [Bacteroidales bacterium]|jgi:O-succinylbenzoate synthase|nr:o-succinylbenzoate synthase [Bacteroidales bacterium]
MLNIEWKKIELKFKSPAGTSRGILQSKNTYFLKVWDEIIPEVYGIGECNLFRGLSFDDQPNYESILDKLVEKPEFYIRNLASELLAWPSIRFGLEMAFLDFLKGGKRILFSSNFTMGSQGIPINGLIWMGDKSFMKEQIQKKIGQGYHCLKLKIGAIDFEEELDLIKAIRREFSKDILELRVDANGAFKPEDAFAKLDALAKLQIHSIEQPIRQGQVEEMATLCAKTPLPIALDEELIGVLNADLKAKLLDKIKPQYIILKPSLVGGFRASEEWIQLADKRYIPWWITSALESNIGLNAIAQWTYSLKNLNYQGLGTGQLFKNNIISPLQIKQAELWHIPEQNWELNSLKF